MNPKKEEPKKEEQKVCAQVFRTWDKFEDFLATQKLTAWNLQSLDWFTVGKVMQVNQSMFEIDCMDSNGIPYPIQLYKSQLSELVQIAKGLKVNKFKAYRNAETNRIHFYPYKEEEKKE